ncbi:MAG: D-alanyl-D-alanine carboxypeptidase precursor [Segetibacter sp.]|nr:D-alanyl-D-alanine carboxypeptidase precursor [Segetibacter sp.]
MFRRLNSCICICTLICLSSLFVNAQPGFDKVDEWLAANAEKMGGRAILVVYQSGKIVHEYSVNQMSRRQKAVGKFIAGRQGETNLSRSVTSPGLFGSFPWIDKEKKYAAFLMTFYLKSDGRNERYKELKQLVDEVLH